VPPAIDSAPVVGLWGMRGSGKTTRARQLVSHARRVVVFDPLAEWCTFPGWTAATGPGEVLALLKRRWRLGWRIAMRPTVADPAQLPAELHRLACLLWDAQRPYPDCPAIVLVVDELNLSYPAHRLPAGLYGIGRLVLQGRHRGVAVVGISQRPALVSLDFRGNCLGHYVHALGAPQDRAAIVQLIGAQHALAIARLAPHQFLEVWGGQVRLSNNRGRPAVRPAHQLATRP